MSADSPSLESKVAFLRDLCGRSDEAIETHFAWVFLTGERAWKLRKPVRRGTMDYQSLEARRLDSLLEVRLNRRLAPQTYLGAVPLTLRRDGGYALGGDGEVADWLVCMRRLDRSRLLDVQLSQRALGAHALRPLVGLLSGFYGAAEPAITDGPAFVARIGRQIAANQQVLATSGLDGVDALGAAQRRFLATREGWLARRAVDGCVVEAHGDLRPEHIFLEDPPCVIDCLEFDRDLRLLDRAEELCFLELECARFDDAQVGHQLLRACLDALGDTAPDRLLSFYRSHRAATRAKLYVWRATEPNSGTPAQWLARAASYLGGAVADAERSLAR